MALEAIYGVQTTLLRVGSPGKILKGATLLANAVRVTLGPKSKCVLIEKAFGRPI